MKTSSKWLIFILVAIAQFMVVLDNAITNVALPTIKQQLHFTTSALQWVVTAYALSFGGFLLLGGRAADLFGRRRTLLIGMSAFTIFSLLVGLSRNSTELIVLRASRVWLVPLCLLLLYRLYWLPSVMGPTRNKALSYWTLVATGGAALGLLLGGVLTEYFGWSWNFFINVPIGIIMTILIARISYQYMSVKKQIIRLISRERFLLQRALCCSSWLLVKRRQWGWLNGRTVGVFVAASYAGGFFLNESRAKHPLMPLSIFKIRNVRGANMIMAPLYASMLGVFFLLTLYVQGILHFHPS